ncbi:MAG: prenyltransferase [Candidatus Micrarchaeota archaeon]|nr:prenyltransferase [Candidatus Micrarchaeota archaeon]
MIKYYLAEMFEPTLLYGLSLSILGVAASSYLGHFNMFYSVLAIAGTVLAQMSVNVISDYFDYASGLDRELNTRKSGNLAGGSSLITGGYIKPGLTLLSGLLAFSAAGAIGLYLLLSRIQLLPILAIAAFTILMYAKYAKRIPYLAEPLCTLNYTMIPLGTFIAVSGASSLSYLLAFSFIPAGIMLGGNALFINEVPDRAIDRKYGVRHSAVMLRTSKRIGIYYIVWEAVAYVIILSGVISNSLPLLGIAGLLTLPITLYVFRGLYNSRSKSYGALLGIHTMSSCVVGLILAFSYASGI